LFCDLANDPAFAASANTQMVRNYWINSGLDVEERYHSLGGGCGNTGLKTMVPA
jgi:hypothetical protein